MKDQKPAAKKNDNDIGLLGTGSRWQATQRHARTRESRRMAFMGQFPPRVQMQAQKHRAADSLNLIPNLNPNLPPWTNSGSKIKCKTFCACICTGLGTLAGIAAG